MKSEKSGGPWGDPDAQLMLRARSGDEEAFAQLVRRHQRAVLNLFYCYLGDGPTAEDAAQEVFVRVYRARDSYEPRAKFSTWLYRITANHCLNAIRAQKARPQIHESVEDLAEQPAEEGPDAGMRRHDMRAAVKEAIASLPPQQRMAVLLARYEELSYQEIAETMGVSLEAVKSLLFRAKENLQQALGKFVKP